ncbi:hypothetical protein PHYC_02650 [Phycisphaerales bacterium]|nr:hypothetical protein PHYC_02650 [Phycisphaerales bacterium]
MRRDPDSGLYTPASRAAESGERRASTRLPAPAATPSPDLDPAKVVTIVARALQHNDDPAPDTGLATLAAFLDEGAKLNDEELPDPEDPDFADDLIDAVEDCPLYLAAHADHCQVDFALETTNVTQFAHPRPMALLQCDYTTDEKVLRVILTLTKGDDSRHPGCYLINSIDCSVRDAGNPRPNTWTDDHEPPDSS